MTFSSRRNAWIVFTELTLYGFLIRIGQLGVILLALQFSQIFTNPAQIIFLFPITIATLIILGLLTLIEIECSRYVGVLDARLNVINSYSSQFDVSGQQNYLGKTILPITLNILALPVVFSFLAWTTPYLFSILFISTLLSCLVIIHYNTKIRRPHEESGRDLNNSELEGETQERIALYLLRNFENTPNIFDKKLISKQVSNQDITAILKTRKRKILSLTRKSTRVIILVAAVTLAVINITNIAKIAGFLIIGNVFRNGCTAIVEYMSSTDEVFPFGKSINLLSEALTETKDLEDRLIKIQQQSLEKRLDFNDKYISLIRNHPYLRLKNVSIKDIDGVNIAANISARVLIDPITVIASTNNKISSRIKILFENINSKSPKALDRYSFGGDIILGRQRLTNNFLSEVTIHDPENIFIASLNIYDYFDDADAKLVKDLISEEKELEVLLDATVNSNIPIEMHNSRQINQFRSILQLLFIYTQPECISLLSYGLDYLEPSDLKILFSIFRPKFKKKSINLIIMSRYNASIDSECSCYQFSPGDLQKI